MKAFLDSSQIRNEGVLLLAPTGKARVRLGQMADGVTAFTIAQFLTKRVSSIGIKWNAAYRRTMKTKGAPSTKTSS